MESRAPPGAAWELAARFDSLVLAEEFVTGRERSFETVTIRGRAVIANPDLFLSPGMFGNMRLSQGGTAKALLVPDEVIRPDQARKTVLVVDANDQVVAKPVRAADADSFLTRIGRKIRRMLSGS